NESAKVQRWRMAVSEFDFEVHHIKGKENLIADGLSRSFVKSVAKISLSDSIKKSQEGFSEDERATLHLENGRWKNSLDRVVIPTGDIEIQSIIVEMFHSGLFSGHYGKAYTLKRIQEGGFYWKGMKHSVDNFIKGCLVCQKTTPKPDPTIMGSLVQKSPFDQISIDLFGPVDPDSQDGSQYITVFVDNFSRF
ncbi:DDE-type integrase/transposase/recombinase, partial [Aduncisulcus paluster]